MGITLSWSNEKRTALLLKYQKPWGWDEFEVKIKELPLTLDQVNHKVHLIIDVREAGFPPQSAFGRFKRAVDIDHPNVAQVIFVAPEAIVRFIKFANDIISKIYGGSYKKPNFVFVYSLEDAYKVVDKPNTEALKD